MVVEGWDPVAAAYFALTTAGVGGMMPPALGPGGELAPAHALAVGAYAAVAVPLFAAATGDAAAALLDDAARRRLRRSAGGRDAGARPVDENEASAAALLSAVLTPPSPGPGKCRGSCGSSGHRRGGACCGGGGACPRAAPAADGVRVDRAGFVLLELLRDGQTDLAAVAGMARRFDEMDGDGDGQLDRCEVCPHSARPASVPRSFTRSSLQKLTCSLRVMCTARITKIRFVFECIVSRTSPLTTI
jgi:hypothetical protein